MTPTQHRNVPPQRSSISKDELQRIQWLKATLGASLAYSPEEESWHVQVPGTDEAQSRGATPSEAINAAWESALENTIPTQR